jgi:hypothetical protein
VDEMTLCQPFIATLRIKFWAILSEQKKIARIKPRKDNLLQVST